MQNSPSHARARNYFRAHGINPSSVSAYYAESATKKGDTGLPLVVAATNAGCTAAVVHHTPLSRKPVKWLVLASNINLDTPVNKRFWGWITDPKISPWRKLLQGDVDIELLPDKNGKIRGFIVPEEFWQYPWSWVFNFLVAARATHEHSKHIQTWSDLVDRGLTPEDAFFLSVNFSTEKNGDLYIRLVNTNHWAFPHTFKFFDRKGAAKGELAMTDRMDGVFKKQKLSEELEYGSSDHFIQKMAMLSKKRVCGRFANVDTYSVKSLAKAFIEAVG